jgi:hypothetical protein
MYQPKGVHSSSLVQNNSLVHGQHLDCVASTMDPNGGNNLNNPSLASKQRLRWTHELHERFVDAVAQLGGPDSESTQPLSGQLDFVVCCYISPHSELCCLFGKMQHSSTKSDKLFFIACGIYFCSC